MKKNKINNYFLSNNNKYLVVVEDLCTNLLNLETNEIKIIYEKPIRQVKFSEDNQEFSGLVDNLTLVFFDLNNIDSMPRELYMNLEKEDCIINTSYCKYNYPIIITKSGHIYNFKKNHILNYNNINQIITSSSIESIDLSNNNGNNVAVLCKDYFFIFKNNSELIHLDNKYFDFNPIKVRFCKFRENLFYLICKDCVKIFRIHNSNLNLINSIDCPNIKDIVFNTISSLIILNADNLNYIFKIDNNIKFTLVQKIKSNHLLFFKKTNVLFFKNDTLTIQDFKQKLIHIKLRMIDKERSFLKNKNKMMIEFMENKIIQYDHALSCQNIDYIKKIHLFLFLTKIPYFFNCYKKDNSNKPLEFPIKNIYPNFKAIDQFIKFIYTDLLPDSKVVFENLEFFIEISDKLWYGKSNPLKVWVDKIAILKNSEYI